MNVTALFIADDGSQRGQGLSKKVKAFIDGDKLFDISYPRSENLPFNKSKKMTGGEHVILFEYKEGKNNADVKFWWQKAGSFTGFYYKNEDMSGNPSFSQTEDKIDHDWGSGGPFSSGSNDNFSVRWVGDFRFDEGAYEFNITFDDSFRFYLDGKLVAENWDQQGKTEEIVRKYLTAGYHNIRLEYREVTGNALAKFSWVKCGKNEFTGRYFTNTDLNGMPAAKSWKPDIDHDWGSGGPFSSGPTDNFSARWAGVFRFDTTHAYEFTCEYDDKMRVWLDGDLLMSDFGRDHNTKFVRRKYITAGYHDFVVEYVEKTGNAKAKFSWVECAVNEFHGLFYDNKEFLDYPNREQYVKNLGHAWYGSNNFSDRHTGVYWFDDGVYEFTVNADDGVKVWIDQERMLNEWQDQNATFTFVKDLKAGYHDIQVDHYQNTGDANIELSWGLVRNKFYAQYYANIDLQGDPKFKRGEDSINNDWGTGGPGNGVPNDNFSARWTGDFEFDEGAYQFGCSYDDGVRLWIDDRLIMDDWDRNHSSQIKARIYLTAGFHNIRTEYREISENAKMKLSWVKCAANEFAGQYFENRLEDSPKMNQWVNNLDFNWGSGSPDANVPADNFSARYCGVFRFDEGAYQFQTEVNDLATIWIDGELLARTENEKRWIRKYMTAGNHDIRVEYTEKTDDAAVKFDWVKCSADEYVGAWFKGTDVTSFPVKNEWIHSQTLDRSNDDFPLDADTDSYSVRWTGVHYLGTDGVYEFTCVTPQHGRVNITLDGAVAAQHYWNEESYGPETLIRTRNYLKAGYHDVSIEVIGKNFGDNAVKFSWDLISTADQYGVIYYNNNKLEGNTGKILEETLSTEDGETVMGIDWGEEGPGDPVDNDNFSARMYGSFEFEAGEYMFTADVNDGIRVWIDGRKILDEWRDPQDYEFLTRVKLAQGYHDIFLEYKEKEFSARCFLKWEKQ